MQLGYDLLLPFERCINHLQRHLHPPLSSLRLLDQQRASCGCEHQMQLWRVPCGLAWNPTAQAGASHACLRCPPAQQLPPRCRFAHLAEPFPSNEQLMPPDTQSCARAQEGDHLPRRSSTPCGDRRSIERGCHRLAAAGQEDGQRCLQRFAGDGDDASLQRKQPSAAHGGNRFRDGRRLPVVYWDRYRIRSCGEAVRVSESIQIYTVWAQS